MHNSNNHSDRINELEDYIVPLPDEIQSLQTQIDGLRFAIRTMQEREVKTKRSFIGLFKREGK